MLAAMEVHEALGTCGHSRSPDWTEGCAIPLAGYRGGRFRQGDRTAGRSGPWSSQTPLLSRPAPAGPGYRADTACRGGKCHYRDNADAILITAGQHGMDLRDLAALAAEMHARSEPGTGADDDPDQVLEDRAARLETT